MDYKSNLARELWNQPNLYQSKMQEYVGVKLDSGIFPDAKRALEYKLKAQSLTTSSFEKISDSLGKSREKSSWEAHMYLKEKTIKYMQEQIFSMNSLKDLPRHLEWYSNTVIELENDLLNYVMVHAKNSDKTEADIYNELDGFRENHDKFFLEHILTNLVLDDERPITENIALSLYNAWDKGQLFSTVNIPSIEQYRTTEYQNLFEILDKYTYDQHGIDAKERLQKHISNAIEKKTIAFKEQRIANNKNITDESDFVNNQIQTGLIDISIPIPDSEEIDQANLIVESNGEINTNKDNVEILTNKVATKKSLINIINDVRLNGELTTAFKDIEILRPELEKIHGVGFNAEELILESVFQQDASGLNYSSIEIFSNLSKSYSDSSINQHTALQSLANNIKKFKHFPKDMVKALNIYTGLDFENDQDFDTLLSMAMVKVNTIGKDKVGNLNKGGTDIAGALDDVFTLFNSHGKQAAIDSWKMALNPDFDSQRKRKEKMDEYTNGRVEELLPSELGGDHNLQGEFDSYLNQAIARENMVQLPFWTSMISNLFRSATGQVVIEDKRNLDNIVKHKQTFIINARKNLMMSESGYAEFEIMFKQNAWKFLRTDNPTPRELERAYDASIVATINQMSEADYGWSYTQYHPKQTRGMVLTKNSPEKLTGINGYDLSNNATAFAYKILFGDGTEGSNMDINDISLQVFGVPYNEVDTDEFEEWKRNFSSLGENGHLKLVLDTTTVDREKKQFHIMIRDPNESEWTMLQKNGEPVSWLPNKMFTSASTQHSRKAINNELVKEKIKELNISDPEMKTDIEELMLKSFTAQDKYAELGDWFQKTFPRWGKDNFRKDDDIDTISEKLTVKMDNFKYKVQKKQEELNIEYESQMDQIVINHRSRFDTTVPTNNQENSINYIRNKNEKILNKYNKIYKDVNVVINPRHQFVLQDIGDAIGFQYIDKNSKLYKHVSNEEWRYALDHIRSELQPLFKNNQRYKELAMYWGLVMNEVK